MDAYKVAVVDLGTNTFNLVLAKVTATAYYVFHSEKVPVMIGRGGISHGYITGDAQARAENALMTYRDIIRRERIDKVYGMATSAFRNAQNGREFKSYLERKSGIPIQIIRGEIEAEYIYKGVASALDIGTEPALIVDIGGGSVEFIIANRNEILWLRSFEIGAQRLLDMFHTKDPIPKKNLHKFDAYLHGQLGDLRAAIKKFRPRMLIGSSGAFDTLSDIFQKKTGISVSLDNKEYPLDIAYVEKIHKELAGMNRDQRLNVPGMIPMRVDMIVVASRLIRYLVAEFEFKTIRVSSHALKEGILLLIQEVLFTEHSTAIGS